VYLSAPDVGELEESYVLEALRSGWVAPLGPSVDAFERELARRIGVEHVIAVNSGTAALHLALLSLGVGPGDVVVVPTLTFVATANAVVYAGAEPVFVDCDPATGNIEPDLLADLLAHLARTGRPARAVITVDIFGQCADYGRILPLCAERGVPVVEDAAEALGATYQGRPAGSFGQAGVVSFNGNKIITTSGGGALLSHDGEVAARGRYLANQARQPVTQYEHTDIGYNYRLSNLLAALGRAQLLRLDEMMNRRRQLREQYGKLFAAMDGVRILGDGDPGANCWLTVVVVDPLSAGWRADDLATYLTARDIEVRPVWRPMHLQPVYAGAPSLLTGAADTLFETGLALPSGSALDDSQTGRVCESIAHFLAGDR
jgi:dTDP-4-amino-4,6-dideoxygalactose transaminase